MTRQKKGATVTRIDANYTCRACGRQFTLDDEIEDQVPRGRVRSQEELHGLTCPRCTMLALLDMTD